MFHPAAQILTWCLLVTTAQHLTLTPLFISSTLVLLLTLFLSARKLLQLLRRTRWLMLSLLMIYAYSTPGQAIFDTLGIFSPSQEGLHDGLMQLARLLLALAGLAILLDKLHRQHWLVGIYTLLAPLAWLGGSRERFAVRLALTLHYAELAMLRGTRRWQDILQDLSVTPAEPAQTNLELPLCRFGVSDFLLLAAALAGLFTGLR